MGLIRFVCQMLKRASFTRGFGIRIPPERVIRTDRFLAARGRLPVGRPAKSWNGKSGHEFFPGRIETSFGGLHYVLAALDNSRPLIVFCGGAKFRESVRGAAEMRALWTFGDILFFDYPGFGRSAGQGTLAEFTEAEQAVRAFAENLARQRGCRLIFWGHSFGGGFAAALAAGASLPSTLVLEGTFSCINDIVKSRAGLLAPFVHAALQPGVVHYPIPKLLAGYRHPVIVVASRRDEVIRFAVTKKLAEDLRRAGCKVSFIALAKPPHEALFTDKDYRPALKQALTEG